MKAEDYLIPYDAQCPHGNYFDCCEQCNFVEEEYHWEPAICHHGNILMDCSKCEAEMDARGGIEKCLNCGQIKYGDQLNKDQVCIRPCRNPNEY